MSRNSRQFSVSIGEHAALTAEKEALYQRYRDNFDGDLASSLEDVLFDDDGRDIFDTRQIEVRDGDRLIAFSFFDVGHDSIESIVGVYDPDYKRHSLGLYTMLLEVEHARESGFLYFYPGYVVPGYSAFDYKLRLGSPALEYFDTDHDQWRPYATLPADNLATHRLHRGLEAVLDAIRGLGLPAGLYSYPLYRNASLDSRYALCLKQPLFVECDPGRAGMSRLLVTYLYEEGVYALEFCVRIADLQDQLAHIRPPPEHPPACLFLLQKVHCLAESSSAARIAETLLEFVSP